MGRGGSGQPWLGTLLVLRLGWCPWACRLRLSWHRERCHQPRLPSLWELSGEDESLLVRDRLCNAPLHPIGASAEAWCARRALRGKEAETPPAQPASRGEGGALCRGREMQIIHDFYKKFRKAFRAPGTDAEMLSAELQVQQRSRIFMHEEISMLPLLLHPLTPLCAAICPAARSYPVLPTPLHLLGPSFAQANAS